jgi:hypothetical protein
VPGCSEDATAEFRLVATRGIVTASVRGETQPVISIRERSRLLVETIELTVPLKDEELILRIELFESGVQARHYCARIWRLEYYRIQPTFPQGDDSQPAHGPSDELVLKEFEGFESPIEEPVEFATQLAAREFVLEQLDQWLTVQLGVS